MRKHPERTERTKAELRQAFWELYAQEPRNITVQQVVDRAGYNRNTFYLHFRDVPSVLESIEAELLAGMTECVEMAMRGLRADNSKLAKLAALKDVILYYERNRTYITVLLGSKGDPTFIPRLKEALKPLWREYVVGPEATAGRSQGEVELLLEYVLTGTLYMVGRWLEEPAGVSAAQMGHLVYDLAIQDLELRANGGGQGSEIGVQ